MTVPSADVARMIAGRAKLADLASLFSPGIEPPALLSPAARRKLRRKLFVETIPQTGMRIFLAARAAVRRHGLGACLHAGGFLVRDKTIGALGLPDPERALASPDGLCGVADDLSVATMMAAYERGLFPSAHFGPTKWWAPRVRGVVAPSVLARRLSDADRGANADFDRDFERALCDGDAEAPTPPRLKWAFAHLFDAGFAHSFDIFARNGEKIGGGFGIAVGRVFVIEALRFKNEEARGAALAALARALEAREFALIDAKHLTPELAACGFDELPRAAYAARLQAALGRECIGRWTSPQWREAA